MEAEGVIVGVPASPPHDAESSAAYSAEMVDRLADAERSNDDEENQSAQTAATDEKDLRAKIIKQVEYYFSDENLPNDKFLMKHVKKDRNGWVSIPLISSFRKMKKLSKDISVIIDALRESSLLVVSTDGKKIRRLNPLPINEAKDVKFCTVVAENLPEDHSEENLCKVFGEIGNVKRISINDPYGGDDAKQNIKMEKMISSKLHAIVEYDTMEAAEKAVAALTDEKDWRNGLRVQLLCKRMEGEHSNENDGRRGRNRRTRGQKQHGNNGMGHGTVVTGLPEASRLSQGPRMPDGTRGFTMGRGRPPIATQG